MFACVLVCVVLFVSCSCLCYVILRDLLCLFMCVCFCSRCSRFYGFVVGVVVIVVALFFMDSLFFLNYSCLSFNLACG